MLNDFFRLNPGALEVATPEDFLHILRHSDSLRDILYKPKTLSPQRPHNRFENKTFTNVSFSKTDLVRLEFKKCNFIDCLFIGTFFDSCDFHACKFVGCNPYKSSFRNTYIDPECFEKMLCPNEHSNIGVGLFQQLLHNSVESRQPRFSRAAEYLFYKWKRYQLDYEYSKEKLTFLEYYKNWVPSILYDYLVGYGIRIFPLVRLTIGFLVFTTIFNHVAWPCFEMHSDTIRVENPSLTTSIYYTVITITTLGYGDLTPTSSFGMNAASFESLTGILWLGLIANTIIKRVIK